MTSYLRVSTKWSDDDVLQLQIGVSDGDSTFVNSAYVALDWFAEVADALERFSRQVYGGLYDLTAGTRGPEFADGALVARFHWYKPTRLLISTWQEADYFSFKGTEVAGT